VRTLRDRWLIDKSAALCASILTGTNLDETDGRETAQLERATQVIATSVNQETLGFLADSTLALLEKVPMSYDQPDRELLPEALPLDDVRSAVQSEIGVRTSKGKRLPEILIEHAVYLLKQPHLSLRDFLRWLKRHKESETRDIKIILSYLDNESSWGAIDSLLDRSRDPSQQTRDRIEAIDGLYEGLMRVAAPEVHMLWWLKLCLSFRSSLYCWPLMIAGSHGRGIHGISLPFGLFLSHDGKSKVYFRIVSPGNSAEHRPYVPGKADIWAHMKDSSLRWNEEWARAFRVGLRVAKRLWSTQNGRLRFVEERVADDILNASLVVDVGAACAIVDSVFGGQDGAPYPLSGRSAEAYCPASTISSGRRQLFLLINDNYS
jgi:hypothetical protein